MNTAKKIYLSICIIAAVAAGIGIYNLSNRSVEQKVYLNASWAMYYEDIPALVEESDVIALVKVTGINKQYSMSGAPMIDFDADVVDLIYSKNQENHLVVTQTGGIIENVTYEIADDPLMEIGNEYLIFGRVNSMGTVTILGGPQGRFVYDDGVLNSLFAVNQNTRGVDDGSNFLSPELDFRNADMDAVLAEINECIEEGEVGGEPELEHLTPAFFDVDKKMIWRGNLV